MSAPVRFLHTFAQAHAAMGLYDPGHPARDSAMDELAGTLRELLNDSAPVVFCFLDDEVVYGDRPLRDIKGWPLGRQLSRKKIQRVEFGRGVADEEVAAFLELVHARLKADGGAEPPASAMPHVSWGPVHLPDEVPLELEETVDAVASLQDEVLTQKRVSESLARGVIQTITRAMRYGQRLLVPLLPLKQADQYTTIHSINVSVLSMGLAEFLQLGGGDVRRIGEAALLHDVGKVLTPSEVLLKPGRLSADEWDVVRRHPVDGARILLRSSNRLELAATVAYEHHVHWDGSGGYPEFRYGRRPHTAARLIQVCDVYDACRTRRPFREPLSSDAAMGILEAGCGTQFDPQFARAFIRMMSDWESRVVRIGAEENLDPAGAGQA